jgi:hypothetical protein
MPGVIGITSSAEESSGNSKIPFTENRLTIYPNPFSQRTTIEIKLAHDGPVYLTLLDQAGNIMKTMINNQSLKAGTYQVSLERANLRNGIYFVQLKLNDYQETKKIITIN